MKTFCDYAEQGLEFIWVVGESILIGLFYVIASPLALLGWVVARFGEDS